MNLERPGPARFDAEMENLMSRRTRHRAVERERRLPDLLDEPAGYRLCLPRVPGKREETAAAFSRAIRSA